MIDLYRFFVSPFGDEDISSSELDNYTPAHLAALVANNPGGVLSSAITITANLHAAFGGTISSETVKLGLQKAATQAKEDFRAALPDEISKIHGAALAKYGRRSPVMLEIFPGGLESFHVATDNELDELFTALVTALEARSADLTAAPHDAAEALQTTWTSLYGSANTAKANRGSTAESRRAAGRALRLQLFRNLLQLAALFPDQPEKAALYCPQHLLENAAAPKPPGNPPVG
jgi:hypothetical protein